MFLLILEGDFEYLFYHILEIGNESVKNIIEFVRLPRRHEISFMTLHDILLM